MVEFNRNGHPLSREELEAIKGIQTRENKSQNFRWIIAGVTILSLGICYIRNKYGKSPLIEIHSKPTEEKKEEKKVE